MSEHEDQNSEMTSFEQDLAALGPRVNGFDRERLIFLAGQAAAMRSLQEGRSRFARWGWPAAFSTMSAVAAGLLVALCLRGPANEQLAIERTKPGAQSVAAVQLDRKASQPDEASAAAPSPDRDQTTVADAAPSWLGSWVANASLGNLESGIDDTTIAEPDPALRAEMRRHGISARRTGGPASRASVVVAESPLAYYELLDRLQGKKPAGQGGLKETMQ